MTTPPSLLNSPFTQLGKFSYNNLLSDDYCHKKFGTFKLKGSTAKNSSYNYKANLQLKTKDRTEVFSLADEYKFGLPYERFYLQTKIQRNGEFEFHLDGGEVEVGKKLNLFACLKTNLNLASFVWQFGVNYFGNKCENNTRIEQSKGEHELANRTVVTQGNVKFGYVASVSLDKFNLKRYDAFLEYEHNKNLVLHLEHLSPLVHGDGVKLGKVIGGLWYKVNGSTALAVQLKNNFSFPKTRVVLGVQHQANKCVTLRGKVDQKGKVTGALKTKCFGVGVTLGAQLNLQHGAKFVNFEKKLPIPFGFTLDYEA